MRPPRSRADFVRLFAERDGISVSYAHQLLRRLMGVAAWEELDARLRAQSEIADLEAARSLTERDFQDAADDFEPNEALDFILRYSSEQWLCTYYDSVVERQS